MPETKIWGIHRGATGDADPLFLQHNVVAIGWVEMGDPGRLKADREAFKAAVIAAYPGIKPGAIPNCAGQVFRFVHEMKIGRSRCLSLKARSARSHRTSTGRISLRPNRKP